MPDVLKFRSATLFTVGAETTFLTLFTPASTLFGLIAANQPRKPPDKSQNDRLLAHLKTKGSINPMEAWSELGIYRLASRANDLRNAGHQINSQLVTVANRFGEKCKVASYTLAQ